MAGRMPETAPSGFMISPTVSPEFETYSAISKAVTTITTTIRTTTTVTTTVTENVEINVVPATDTGTRTSSLDRGNIPSKHLPDAPQDARMSSAPATPGTSLDTHIRVDYNKFIKNILNEDAIRYTSTFQVAQAIIINNVYRQRLSDYLYSLQSPSNTSNPESSLMRLFNCIAEIGPSCGLNKPYPLEIEYISQDSTLEGAPRCAAVLRDLLPKDSGCPVIVIHVHQPETETLDDPTPIGTRFGEEIPGPNKRKRQSRSPKIKGKKSRRISPLPSASPLDPTSPIASQPSLHILSSPEMPHAGDLTRDAFNAMGSLGVRRHVLGILVRGLDVFFSYYDRAGSIFSSRVHLMDDEVHLITAILSLALCTPAQFGFEPCIHPASPSLAPIPIAGCSVDVEGRQLILDKLLHSSKSEFGRGTVVFAAHPTPAAGSSTTVPTNWVVIPDVVVVKFSWQILTQDSEDTLFRHAAKSKVQGVAKLYLSAVAGRLSEGVRGKVIKPKDYLDRELRVQVMGPMCIPLYKVKSLDDFKAAYISLVRAHHDLYERAGILHRDISINNLMVDQADHRRGVLIDLDLSAIVKDEAGNDIDVKPTVTGTVPFLAIDLLRDTPPPKSYYRHDLESFLYVLVWISANYENGKLIPTHVFDTWYNRDWENIELRKSGFLGGGMVDYTTSQYEPLERTWLLHLRRLIARGLSALSTHEADVMFPPAGKAVENFDDATLGGHVTYEKFMAILTSL